MFKNKYEESIPRGAPGRHPIFDLRAVVEKFIRAAHPLVGGVHDQHGVRVNVRGHLSLASSSVCWDAAQLCSPSRVAQFSACRQTSRWGHLTALARSSIRAEWRTPAFPA